ncbi:MAG: outer membrane beta-barrel protein [Prevotellaceae bacterium]|nr:outer membrane beta-barrel protein [Prevotellaceae bacterium]
MMYIIFLFSFSAGYSQVSLSGYVKTVEREQEVILHNVNVVVLTADSIVYTGTVTDNSGFFKTAGIAKGAYKVLFSLLGYKFKFIDIDITNSADSIFTLDDVYLNENNELLQEITVEARRVQQNIDNRKYTFSREQIIAAREARDLMLNIPNLHISQVSSSLSELDGKTVLILINGVKSNDSELKLIPAHKIRYVEFYDIPPLRYNTSGKVLNIITKELDSGWAGDFYLIGGQFFSMLTPYISHVNGKHKLTLGYDLHVNHKRNISDISNGEYGYTLDNNDYVYNYQKEEKNWGSQQSFSLEYSNVKMNNYTFQAKAGLGLNRDNYDESREIKLYAGDNFGDNKGLLTNRVKSFATSLDIYCSKTVKENHELNFNVFSTVYNNDQNVYSEEKGISNFIDNMLLDSRKTTIIGEINYLSKIGNSKLSLGYRTGYSTVNNSIMNSLTDGAYFDNNMNLSEHCLYGDISGRIKNIRYKAGLGSRLVDNRYDGLQYHSVFFVPLLILAYQINGRNSIRVTYNSSTKNPEVQQLSDNAVLIMDNFIRKGNPGLKNSFNHDFRIMYGYAGKTVSADAALFYENSSNFIFDYFEEEVFNNNKYITVASANAGKNLMRGINANVSLLPVKWLTLGCYFQVYSHVFQPSKTMDKISKRFYPVTLFASLKYENFSFDCYQKLNSDCLEGMYIMGTEKVSWLSAGYSVKNWAFQLNCYFPFLKNTFTNNTIEQSAVKNTVTTRLRTKEKTVGISVSWRFNTSEKQYGFDRNIYNEDTDNGVFNIK